MRRISLVCFLFAMSLVASAQGEKLDQDMLAKIRTEGMNNSKAMEWAFYLTDANGPRLMNSPGYLKAANWAKSKLTEFGLKNAAVEPYGEFGKSWELEKSYLALSTPYYRPINAFPKSWCEGTKGLHNAEVIILAAKDSMELESYRGKLKGKIVVMAAHDTLKQTFMADASRQSEEELKKMSDFDPKSVPARGGFPGGGRRGGPGAGALNPTRIRAFLKAEGAIAILSTTHQKP